VEQVQLVSPTTVVTPLPHKSIPVTSGRTLKGSCIFLKLLPEFVKLLLTALLPLLVAVEPLPPMVSAVRSDRLVSLIPLPLSVMRRGITCISAMLNLFGNMYTLLVFVQSLLALLHPVLAEIPVRRSVRYYKTRPAFGSRQVVCSM
jgi:hypothetical protein